MRRSAVLLCVAAVVWTVPPAESHLGSHDVTFTAGVPCGLACPYYLEELNTDLDDDGEYEIYFDACAAPAPWMEGTAYDDVITEAMPSGADFLAFKIQPSIDSDSFICELGDTWDGDGIPNEDMSGGICLCEPCYGPLGIGGDRIPLGCREVQELPAKAGKQVVLRVYNWSDVAVVHGTYEFVDV